MIEKIMLDYLNQALSAPCYMEIPADPPERYVVIEKTGSGVENHVYSATFAIQSYAGSLYDAAALNEAAKAAMDDLVVLDEIARSRLNSDYNYTDANTKRYRYQAVYDITHYEE